MSRFLETITGWLLILVPQPCFDEFFVKYNFLQTDCLKIVLSKGIGIAIILGSILVKIPQIVKILRAGSAQGLNIIAVTLELLAVAFSLVYGYASGFPFSAYGEAVFLLIQTIAVVLLVLVYNGRTFVATVYFAVFSGMLAYLLSPLAPKTLLWYLQASVMPNVALSRLIQAVTNYRNGSTGQLSAITVFLLFGGAVARVFTSVQETGDKILVLTYVVSSLCNGIIAAQILYYWNSGKKVKNQLKVKKSMMTDDIKVAESNRNRSTVNKNKLAKQA